MWLLVFEESWLAVTNSQRGDLVFLFPALQTLLMGLCVYVCTLESVTPLPLLIWIPHLVSLHLFLFASVFIFAVNAACQ